jgi:predicted nuclease of restriction endonuclease-like (RecB) superfamily
LPVESNLSLLDNPVVLQTVSSALANRFLLGWTHYVALLTISNPEERRFYEIEAHQNSWGARELERQIAASLYQRLLLSRDQAEVRALSEHGLIFEKAADVVKNPYVLEFLDLEENSAYSEHELEAAIINKLEHFLLEQAAGIEYLAEVNPGSDSDV